MDVIHPGELTPPKLTLHNSVCIIPTEMLRHIAPDITDSICDIDCSSDPNNMDRLKNEELIITNISRIEAENFSHSSNSESKQYQVVILHPKPSKSEPSVDKTATDLLELLQCDASALPHHENRAVDDGEMYEHMMKDEKEDSIIYALPKIDVGEPSIMSMVTSTSCDICGMNFKSPKHLTLHMKFHEHDEDTKTYQCNICDETFTEINARDEHFKNCAQDKPYRCDKCAKTFSMPSVLKRHMTVHHQDQTSACITCGENCACSCSQGTDINKCEKKNIKQEKDVNCSTCGKSFSSWSSLRQHSVVHSTKKCFLCSICGSSFRRSGDLSSHMRSHSGKKSYKCKVCEKSFTYSRTLTSHMRLHTGNKPYKCAYCDKSFPQSGQRNSHMRTHTKEKPYKCTLCEKNFSTASNLRTHIKTHTSETGCTTCGKKTCLSTKRDIDKTQNHQCRGNSFKCPTCGKGFVNRSSLNRHAVMHSDEKPFLCTICGTTFSRAGDLRSHIQSHSENKSFKCTVCGKNFTYSRTLASHMKLHTGDKSYQCLYCDKKFAQSGQRNSHMRIHTRERPYKCSVCERSFSGLSNLKRHLKTHETTLPCLTCGEVCTCSREFEFKIEPEDPLVDDVVFECSTCGEKSTDMSYLEEHVKIHDAPADLLDT